MNLFVRAKLCDLIYKTVIVNFTAVPGDEILISPMILGNT